MSYDLATRFMSIVGGKNARVGILMSGGGSNANQILLDRGRYPNLDIASLITDQETSNAETLSKRYGVQYHCQNAPRLNQLERETYFLELANYLVQEKITALIYAGFMKIVPDSFLSAFPGINSHPADLRVLDAHGKRKYVGMDAIPLTLKDQTVSICCSCCVVDNPVDNGEILSISNSIIIQPEERVDPLTLHSRLKQEAEWLYYPRTIEKIAKNELTIPNMPYIFEEGDYD